MPSPQIAAAYDALPLGVAVLDPRLVIEAWNTTLAKWSGVRSEQAIGKTLLEVFPNFRAERFERRLDCVFRHGQSAVLSTAMHQQFLPLRTAGGKPLYHKTHASPAPCGPGRALIVVEDVTTTLDQLETLRTERRRLQASEKSLRGQRQILEAKNAAIAEARRRAEAASRAKSEFLANMSHEIRTPLTAINGFAAVLTDHAESPVAVDAAERVLRNGEHLLAVVNDILDLSKIEAGAMRLRPVACRPEELVDQVRQTLGARADEKGIELRVALSEDTPSRIEADGIRLQQVLLNLVGNAVKFTESGSVSISVSRARVDSAPGIRFRVADTGVGIDPHKLASVFEPFSQEDSSAQRRFGGTGLGLTISRQLMTLMGGRITACSEPGVGSTFTVVMPIGEPERFNGRPQAARDQAPAVPQSQPLRGRRLLVAEDGPDNRALIEYVLERAGAEAHLVENGLLAVEAVERSAPDRYDLLLLDMQMPVMDGYAAAARLRDNDVRLPIVALTAHAMDGDRTKALDAGCDAYATKPINSAKLIELLAGMIEGRPASAPASGQTGGSSASGLGVSSETTASVANPRGIVTIPG